MNFIFAKLYEEYVRKDDVPSESITTYISLIYLFVAFDILLPVKTLIDKKIFNNQIDYERSTITIVVFALAASIYFIVRKIYVRNKFILKLVDRYKERKINKILLNVIIVLTPVTLLLLGATITVFLTGGEILGKEISGLIK